MKRCRWTLVAAGVLLSAAASMAWAQAPAAAEPNAPAVKPAPQAVPADIAQLRAKIHRTMADLIEAQSAQQPDQANIDQLTKTLQELRAQLRAAGGSGPAQAGAATGWQCPWGGPGLGRGPGWGGGRGQGWGRGQGPGPGPGWGRGAGLAPGGGRGPGAGRGAGFGPGAGQGLGPGPGFVDKDGNGVCDYFEAVRAEQKK